MQKIDFEAFSFNILRGEEEKKTVGLFVKFGLSFHHTKIRANVDRRNIRSKLICHF